MSDVHANPRALETALADSRRFRCGRYVMLGDTTGYGYDAVGALRLVRSNFDVVLMGNHDSACAGLESRLETLVNRNYSLDVAQRDELSPAALSWLRSRPRCVREDDKAFAHGDFTAPGEWRYVFEADEARACFAADAARVMFCGHTHHAAVWQLSPDGVLRERFAGELAELPARPETLSLEISGGCRLVVNAGSVGYPRNDLCATYALYDDVARRVAIRRMPFDFRSYVADMSEAGLGVPQWLEQALRAAL